MRRNILRIKADREAIFLERKNKFLASVKIGNAIELAHIHDSGRLADILYPGNKVLLKRAENEKRKTAWDIIAGWTGYWTLANSGFHGEIAHNILKIKFPGYEIKAEKKHGSSRIDFLLEGKNRIWIEVKGCTMLSGRAATFPDAPTERGRKHVEELLKIVEQGGNAAMLFLIFRKEAECFVPNKDIDTNFSEIFWKAIKKGVKFYGEKLSYDGENIYWDEGIEMC